MSPEKPRRLGRGLEALIGTPAAARIEGSPPPGSSRNELQHLALSLIRPNPFQPRRDFPEAELAELRASLKASGMLQPVVVRPVAGGFELISGERRFRAASELGWREIPALIREADERTMLTLALIENLQRADLNVVDEARGYQRLQEEFDLTHQQISEAVGKDRSTVTNVLRLLALPPDVQALLEHGHLSMGHARALLSLASAADAAKLATEIVAAGLSVRETERRVRETAADTASPRRKPRSNAGTTEPTKAHALRHIEASLRRQLQTDIAIQADASAKGTIRISFYSADDLNRILELIVGPPGIGD